jgi:hypothetical protein
VVKRKNITHWKDPPCFFHGKTKTISTGPFSSSRTVSHYQAGYTFRCDRADPGSGDPSQKPQRSKHFTVHSLRNQQLKFIKSSFHEFYTNIYMGILGESELTVHSVHWKFWDLRWLGTRKSSNCVGTRMPSSSCSILISGEIPEILPIMDWMPISVGENFPGVSLLREIHHRRISGDLWFVSFGLSKSMYSSHF